MAGAHCQGMKTNRTKSERFELDDREQREQNIIV